MNVICALKSGGDYTPEYVYNLFHGVRGSLSISFNFICVSDMAAPWKVPLRSNLPGWWSKLEAFRVPGPSIYLDLDTYLPESGSLDVLANRLKSAQEDCIYMMQPIYQMRMGQGLGSRWASGVMAWTGDWSWLYEERPENPAPSDFDQIWLSDKLQARGIVPECIQDFVELYSYKWHCQQGVPDGADVVCFHGHPRPHEVGGEYWRSQCLTKTA